MTIISRNKSIRWRIIINILTKEKREEKNERIWEMFIDQNIFFSLHRLFIIFDLFYHFDVSSHLDNAKVSRGHGMTSTSRWHRLTSTPPDLGTNEIFVILNVITRLEKLKFRTYLMKKLHRNCKELYEIDHKTLVYGISRYVKISKNLQTNK